jgi:hypothetical protein
MLGQRRGGVARSGKASRKGLRWWASSQATSGGCQRQEVALAELQRRSAAAAHCAAEGEQRKKEGGGVRQGLRCKLQKFQGPRCKTRFSHCFIYQMRKW